MDKQTERKRRGFSDPDILSKVREIRETTDPLEAARLLSSGRWLGVFAVVNGNVPTFSLGRIS